MNKKFTFYSKIFLIIGLSFLGLSFYNMYSNFESLDSSRPFLGYLLGLIFWLSIGLGMLFLTQIWYVFHARWTTIIRRQCEHFFSIFPCILLLFLPILLLPIFMPDHAGIIWKWLDLSLEVPGSNGTLISSDPLYKWKSAYLNYNSFLIRSVLIFMVIISISYCLKKWSFNNDKVANIANLHNARRLSSVGLFLLATASTLGAIDWIKSLDYHWFSTMYGVWFFAASVRVALCVIFIFCVIFSTKDYLDDSFNRAHRYDLSCMMLAFTVFWAYISFSQYFLIHNANIPEETFWYNIRNHDGYGNHNSWWNISMLLIFGHFLIPFLLLLWYNTKIVIWRTIFVCIWIISFHILDLYWNIIPGKIIDSTLSHGYYIRDFSISIFDVTSIIGIGGICLWAVFRSMNQTNPIPINDPNVLKSINHSE